jgi:hypothetical protein
VVFHRRLHPNWRPRFTASHLSYTGFASAQYQAAVKVHGVFPSDRGYAASSPRLQFHRAPGRDSAPLVTPFMQVGTYPTRNFATLGPLELRPPFTRALVGSFALRLTPPLTYWHRAGVRPYTSPYGLAEPCVFVKQSAGPLHCGPPRLFTPQRAPLLPKLRGQIAEFLNGGYPARLWILSSPTCVGFRYGHLNAWHRGFSRHSVRPSSPVENHRLPIATVNYGHGFAYAPSP